MQLAQNKALFGTQHNNSRLYFCRNSAPNRTTQHVYTIELKTPQPEYANRMSTTKNTDKHTHAQKKNKKNITLVAYNTITDFDVYFMFSAIYIQNITNKNPRIPQRMTNPYCVSFLWWTKGGEGFLSVRRGRKAKGSYLNLEQVRVIKKGGRTPSLVVFWCILSACGGWRAWISWLFFRARSGFMGDTLFTNLMNKNTWWYFFAC